MGLSAAAKFRNVAKRLLEVPSRVAADVAPVLERRLRATYLAGQDPYGKPLAPLKASTIRRKGGDARIMIRTEETLQLTNVRPLSGAGIAIKIGPKAEWHLEPTPDRVARPLVPLHGAPARWIADISAAYVRCGWRAIRG